MRTSAPGLAAPWGSPLACRRPAAAGLLIRRGLEDGAEIGPVGHHLHTLFEQVAAPLGGLDLVADRMREGHFCGLVRVVRPLAALVAEGAAEAVRRGRHVHAAADCCESHVREPQQLTGS